jgi:hypothetical protein
MGIGAVAVLALAACRGPDLTGTWAGEDEQGRQVSYTFLTDGTGYRIVGGSSRESFAYELTEGYPNRLDIVLTAGGSPEVRQGLVEIASDVEIRLEFAPAGQAAPTQLSPAALSLRRPPTR